MAKSNKSQPPRKPQNRSQKQNNVRGFAKRQLQKSQKTPRFSDHADVYEYQPDKVRRSKVKLQLERDELDGVRDDPSGSEDGADPRGGGRPRLVGESDDEGGIGEDEDEEIDSDAAFDESDEERFAGFSFASKVCILCPSSSYITYLHKAENRPQETKIPKGTTCIFVQKPRN